MGHGEPRCVASRRHCCGGTALELVRCASAPPASRGPSWSRRSCRSKRRSRGWTRPGSRSCSAIPSPSHLARASTADVLRAWAGLGYNRRALNLQRAAAAIVAEHAGRVPGSVEAAGGAAGRRAIHRARGRRHRLRPAGRGGRHQRASGGHAPHRRSVDPAASAGRGRCAGRDRRSCDLDARLDGAGCDRLRRPKPALRRLPGGRLVRSVPARSQCRSGGRARPNRPSS